MTYVKYRLLLFASAFYSSHDFYRGLCSQRIRNVKALRASQIPLSVRTPDDRARRGRSIILEDTTFRDVLRPSTRPFEMFTGRVRVRFVVDRRRSTKTCRTYLRYPLVVVARFTERFWTFLKIITSVFVFKPVENVRNEKSSGLTSRWSITVKIVFKNSKTLFITV